jgi:hypothetical protein
LARDDAQQRTHWLLYTVAERLGYASTPPGEKPKLTAVPSVRKRLLDAVNRAGRRFASLPADERSGRQWSWKMATWRVTLTAAGTSGVNTVDQDGVLDPTRFVLPDSVQGVSGHNAAWSAEGGFSGSAVRMAPHTVEGFNLRDTQAGSPRAWAIEQFMTPGATPGMRDRTRRCIQVYPKPDRSYTLAVPVRLQFVDLAELTDAPPWGPEHDVTVALMAVADLLSGGETAPSNLTAAAAKAEAAESLQASRMMDVQDAPAVIDPGVDVSSLAWSEGRCRTVVQG